MTCNTLHKRSVQIQTSPTSNDCRQLSPETFTSNDNFILLSVIVLAFKTARSRRLRSQRSVKFYLVADSKPMIYSCP